MAKRFYWLFAILFLCGCVISPLRNGVTTGGGSKGGKLYVSTAGSILRFGSALSANGNVAPEVSIATSQLNSPARIFLDTANDRLFVANKGAGSVLIFSPASTTTATSTPSAVLTSTGNMVAPVDVAIDPSASVNLLYVADGKNILVFSSQSTLSGNQNTSPVRTMNVPFTIGAIFLNASTNTLFIADAADNTVAMLQSASAQTGDVTLLLTQVTGAATTLNAPNGMTLDSGGRLIVSNGGTAAGVLIFPSVLVPTGGNAAPSATISGSSTNIKTPGQMVFNSGANGGELYVADSGTPGILIFTNINSASGNITSAPTRSITGSGTQLNAAAVNGVALDTTR